MLFPRVHCTFYSIGGEKRTHQNIFIMIVLQYFVLPLQLAINLTGADQVYSLLLINWHGPVFPLSSSFHLPSSFRPDHCPLTVFPLSLTDNRLQQRRENIRIIFT